MPGQMGRLQINSHSGTDSLSSCLLRVSLLFPLLPQSKQLWKVIPWQQHQDSYSMNCLVLSRWLPLSVLLLVTLDGAIPYLLCRHSDVKSRQHSRGNFCVCCPLTAFLTGFQEGPRT